MRRFNPLTALLAFTAVSAGAAHAGDADFPELRPSTFEVSAGAFGALNNLRSSYAGGPAASNAELDGDGYGVGLRLGADYVSGGWVFGVLGDWAFSRQSAEDDAGEAELDMPNLFTLRARAGGKVGDALLYVTGGLAQAELQYSLDSGVYDDSDTAWGKGWTVGAGAEYALTDSLTLGAEYLYIRLDDVEYELDNDLGNPVSFDREIDAIHTVRLGLNYYFKI